MIKSHPTIGCCGIDCGLCPRFYTKGNSRCPGCGGTEFQEKHPACSVLTCCHKKQGLEVCSQCAQFPCRKFADREKIQRDSFVTHKRIFPNHQIIKAVGLEKFLSKQDERISILQDMLENFNDGRSKSCFCIAAALLPIQDLKKAIADMSAIDGDAKCKAKALKSTLAEIADKEGIKLTLSK